MTGNTARGGGLSRVHPVVVVGLSLVLLQLVFRAWAVYNSWFYGDDWEYLLVATRHDLTLDYLLLPHGGHLLPMTRLAAWVVVATGNPLSWVTAATITLALQVGASLAALWCFLTLFGRRWVVLAPLAIYYTSAITFPAYVWWAAALNQVGHQAGLFLAIGAWVNFERTRRWWWFAATLGGIALSLFCDVRAVFIPPTLAMISLLWFSRGNSLQRAAAALARCWFQVLVVVVVFAGYWFYYRQHAEDIMETPSWGLARGLANDMLVKSFATGIMGGPWRWRTSSPPTSFADPPLLATILVWVVLALVVSYALRTRKHSLRAFAFLGVYLSMLYLLVLTSRAPLVGASLGTEYRYLTDSAAIATLALAMAFLPILGASEHPQWRSRPQMWVVPRPGLVAGLVGAVAVSGTICSARYLLAWQQTNNDEYVSTLTAQIESADQVDLSDGPIPGTVVDRLVWQTDRMKRLSVLLPGSVRFPTSTDNLGVVSDTGTVTAARIDPATQSPPGPSPGCGWKITSGSLLIPMEGDTYRWDWWLRIGYLAPESTDAVIRAGSSRVRVRVEAGLNNLYVHVLGAVDSVEISGLPQDMTMCVDKIEVGKAVPGGQPL